MQRAKLPLAILALFVLCLGIRLALEKRTRPLAESSVPQRIVSLAPSITETLFAVGLGDKVIGVTQFCNYPPEAEILPKVAGFSEINLEALIRVQPDLVVMPTDKTVNKAQIERLGIPVLSVEVVRLEGLKKAIKDLSGLTSNRTGELLLTEIDERMAWAETWALGKPRPGVLFSVMHAEQGLGYISEISAIGRDGFYDGLIELAGGRNVYEGTLPYPRLSREAIIFLNPDVIIDVIPASENAYTVWRDWMSLTSVNAIKNKRLFILTDEMHTVPGPRFTQTLELMSFAFHPDPSGQPKTKFEAGSFAPSDPEVTHE